MLRALGSVFVILIFGGQSVSHAHTIKYTSKGNPAVLQGEFDGSCSKLYESFEKKIDKLLAKIPNLSDVRLMETTKEEEVSRSGLSVTKKKLLYFSVQPNRPKEFPYTFVSATSYLNTCLTPANGNKEDSDCNEKFTFSVSGREAIQYVKVVELGSDSNYMSSFNTSITFTEADEDEEKCLIDSTLVISDNNYLWVKKHLIGDFNPTEVQNRILSGFLDWSQSVFKDLEN